ncbi:MAG: electron transporter RnfD [Oscillospiraceae bacterium]|nr:electron transporter RnfD [Oscillospiraceae bacterium]
MEIKHTDERINYYGRIDHKEDGAYFYFPSTSAEVRFKGTEISAVINANIVWGTTALGYVIDGRMGQIPLSTENNGKDVWLQLANSLEPDTEHTLVLYKRQAASISFAFKSFSCDGEFLCAPEKPALKLEFYGDSVSAGEVTEAYDFVGRSDPASHGSAYDNSYLSYTWQTARLLGAQLHNIAQGGIAVFDDTGYFHAPKMIGMESVYDKMCYFPEGGEITDWDFSRYTPDFVVFALGQNDKHNGITDADDIDIYDPETRKKWKEGYKAIASDIYKKYGEKSKLIFLTTVLMHDPEWDKAIDEIVNELNESGVTAYHKLFARNGAATPGHPRYQEQKEMAEELADFIKGLMNG